METALTERKQAAIAKQQDKQWNSWVLTQLMWLAEVRQASVSPDTLALYLKEINLFDQRDIERAIRKMGRKSRREGETAFPDLGSLLEAIGREKMARYEAEQQAEYQKYLKDIEEHPEKFVSIADIVKEFLAKRGQAQ